MGCFSWLCHTHRHVQNRRAQYWNLYRTPIRIFIRGQSVDGDYVALALHSRFTGRHLLPQEVSPRFGAEAHALGAAGISRSAHSWASYSSVGLPGDDGHLHPYWHSHDGGYPTARTDLYAYRITMVRSGNGFSIGVFNHDRQCCRPTSGGLSARPTSTEVCLCRHRGMVYHDSQLFQNSTASFRLG